MNDIVNLDEHEIELIKTSLIIMPIFYERMAENCLNDGFIDTTTKNSLRSVRKMKELLNDLTKVKNKEEKIVLILSKIAIIKKITSEINFINNNEKTKKDYNKIYEKIKDIN